MKTLRKKKLHNKKRKKSKKLNNTKYKRKNKKNRKISGGVVSYNNTKVNPRRTTGEILRASRAAHASAAARAPARLPYDSTVHGMPPQYIPTEDENSLQFTYYSSKDNMLKTTKINFSTDNIEVDIFEELTIIVINDGKFDINEPNFIPYGKGIYKSLLEIRVYHKDINGDGKPRGIYIKGYVKETHSMRILLIEIEPLAIDSNNQDIKPIIV
jgi:hypothetical protein